MKSNNNIKLNVLINDKTSNLNLKPILGQSGILYKNFELEFNNLIRNFPSWSLNIFINIENVVTKKFRIYCKNFNIKFFINQYLLYKNEINILDNNNLYLTIDDIIYIYYIYIYSYEKILKKELNKKIFLRNLIGILRTYNIKLLKN